MRNRKRKNIGQKEGIRRWTKLRERRRKGITKAGKDRIE